MPVRSAKQYGRLEGELDAKNETILRLTAQLEAQAENSRRLELELERTRELLEYAEKQFISLDRGIQGHQTKASAVAALAEARLAYDKIIRDNPAAKRIAKMSQARDKIEKSDELLTHQRYAASVYFAKRATQLIEETQGSRAIRIVSVEQANVRNGPGMNYDIINKLALGTVLFEVENSSPWLRIETRDGQSGWIHESVTVTR